MNNTKVQKISGKNNIQIEGGVGGDVILQILDGIHSLNDLDGAIQQAQSHLEILQKRKGRIDGRIILALIGAGCLIAANSLPVMWSLLFLLVFLGIIFLGIRLNVLISRIDSDITATNLVIVELYRQKLIQKLGADKNDAKQFTAKTHANVN